MLSLEQALEQLLSSLKPLGDPAQTSVAAAIGQYLAADVHAASPLPRFDNSAMDGWAARSADVQSASAQNPVALRCIASVPAGENFTGNIATGECARIFTGSPIPTGCNAVVMQEDARAELPQVFIFDPVKPWENIRFLGEDVKQNAVIARAGQRLTPQLAALISACGVAAAIVHRRPRIAILATGAELKSPGENLRPGEIYESNRILISNLARQIGVEPVIKEIVPDELPATIAAFREAAEADAIITCGGVSVGDYDFVKSAIAELGGSIDFWRIAIKPGKPFLHATLFNKPLFGLPGNPVSALVTFWMLVRPALLKMSGANEVDPPMSFGKLAEEISNHGDRRHFMRVTLDDHGEIRASGPQASHRLASLAAANALLDLPPNAVLETGRLVPVILLP